MPLCIINNITQPIAGRFTMVPYPQRVSIQKIVVEQSVYADAIAKTIHAVKYTLSAEGILYIFSLEAEHRDKVSGIFRGGIFWGNGGGIQITSSEQYTDHTYFLMMQQKIMEKIHPLLQEIL